jgi:TFIIE alpha subunit
MSSLLFDEPPLVVSPTLARVIGLQEAIVLQQIHYWAAHSKTVHDGRRWVYNTYEEWAVQFPFWKPESIRKIVANLRDERLIDIEKLSSDRANRTNYYAINYDRLREIAGSKTKDHPEESTAPSGKDHRINNRKNPPVHPEESTGSLYKTETTTETTQKSAPRRPRAARDDISLMAFLETCRANGEKAIPEDDPILKYADTLKMDREFIWYAWQEFKSDYADESKKQKDWRAHFRNAVRKNWLKLWFLADDGNWLLTTRGKQVQREHSEGA